MKLKILILVVVLLIAIPLVIAGRIITNNLFISQVYNASGNVSYHEQFYKHGNTTAEIEAVFISFYPTIGAYNYNNFTSNYATMGAYNTNNHSAETHDYTIDSNASTGCDDDRYLDGNGLCILFNETVEKITSTTFFNASNISVITGTPQGNIGDIQSYNNIPYNVSEVDSDLELRINFTNIIDFNQLIVRYKSDEEDEPHTLFVQIYDYEDSDWEGYGVLPAQTGYSIVQFGVYDSDEHISGGVVQVRFYQLEGVPNKQHKHNFDWVTIAKGFGTPSGEEVDPDFNSWLLKPFFDNVVNATKYINPNNSSEWFGWVGSSYIIQT